MITTEDRAILAALDLAETRREVRRQTEALDQQWKLFVRWKRRSFHHWPPAMLEAYRSFLNSRVGP